MKQSTKRISIITFSKRCTQIIFLSSSFLMLMLVSCGNNGVKVNELYTDEEIKAHQDEVLEAFNSAKGFIRSRIGHEMKLRHTPELIFKVDHSMEYSRHIEDLISTL